MVGLSDTKSAGFVADFPANLKSWGANAAHLATCGSNFGPERECGCMPPEDLLLLIESEVKRTIHFYNPKNQPI
jgi:hypothetical protein